MNRSFKGIWIPKEVWFDKSLTWMEKLMLMEIHSLDNGDGCYASNNYLAEFFNLSPGRVSQIINSLKDKNFIEIKYIRDGKKVEKRVVNILKGVFNILKGGIKYSKGGYLEYDEDRSIDNRSINKEVYAFDDFWNVYNKKVDRRKCELKWNKITNANKEKIKEVLPQYVKSTPDDKYRKNPLTWLNGECWNDEITEKKRVKVIYNP